MLCAWETAGSLLCMCKCWWEWGLQAWMGSAKDSVWRQAGGALQCRCNVPQAVRQSKGWEGPILLLLPASECVPSGPAV